VYLRTRLHGEGLDARMAHKVTEATKDFITETFDKCRNANKFRDYKPNKPRRDKIRVDRWEPPTQSEMSNRLGRPVLISPVPISNQSSPQDVGQPYQPDISSVGSGSIITVGSEMSDRPRHPLPVSPRPVSIQSKPQYEGQNYRSSSYYSTGTGSPIAANPVLPQSTSHSIDLEEDPPSPFMTMIPRRDMLG
jgi:hypothetical protein